MFGAVAGLCFGTLAVMVDAASDRASYAGVQALFTSPRGVVPLAGILLLGGAGILLTQLSFQVGALSATLPANLAVDPTTGVVLGTVLLGERIPLSPLHALAYGLCFVAVVAGTIRLAEPRPEPAGRRTAVDAGAGRAGGSGAGGGGLGVGGVGD